MEDLYFDNKNDFNEYLKTATKFSNQGLESITYKKDNLVIKDFGAKPKFDTSHILQYRDTLIEDFFFPQAGIYIRAKLRACITEYAPGLPLADQNLFLENITTLLKAVKRLENAIKEVSESKIRMADVNAGNVLFDNDHFNFIDTTAYYRSPLEYEEILKLNMKRTMQNIYTKILPKELFDFQLLCRGKNAMYNYPSERLEELSYYLERLLGKFSSFGEAEKMIEEEKIVLPLM